MRKIMKVTGLCLVLLTVFCSCSQPETPSSSSEAATPEPTPVVSEAPSTAKLTEMPTVAADEQESSQDIASGAEEDGVINPAMLTMDDLVGKWYDISTFTPMELRQDGSALIPFDTGDSRFSWKVEYGRFFVNNEYDGDIRVTDDNKIQLLSNKSDTFCQMRFEDIPMIDVSDKEYHSGKMMGITYEDIEFLPDLPEDIQETALENPHLEENDVDLEESQVYAKITAQIENLSTEAIVIGNKERLLYVILNYNNGYLYSTEDESVDFFTDGRTVATYKDKSAISIPIDTIEIQPLDSKEITIYMRCPRILSENMENPLDVVFISRIQPEAVEYFKYQAR